MTAGPTEKSDVFRREKKRYKRSPKHPNHDRVALRYWKMTE